MPNDDDFCLIHGKVLVYDRRSGFDICPQCERDKPTLAPLEAQGKGTPLRELDVLELVIHDVVSAWGKTGNIEMLEARLAERIRPHIEAAIQEAEAGACEAYEGPLPPTHADVLRSILRRLEQLEHVLRHGAPVRNVTSNAGTMGVQKGCADALAPIIAECKAALGEKT